MADRRQAVEYQAGECDRAKGVDEIRKREHQYEPRANPGNHAEDLSTLQTSLETP